MSGLSRWLLPITALLALLPATAIAKETQVKLTDGMYQVLRISNERNQVEPITGTETLLVNDFHFIDPSERGKTEYVVLQSKAFVPFILEQEPTKDKDSEGKPKLLLKLAEDQIKPLEEFTRKNTGGKVAVVIGGEIVTVHKVREPITGGRLQITRCTDRGCEAIYTEIQKKAH